MPRVLSLTPLPTLMPEGMDLESELKKTSSGRQMAGEFSRRLMLVMKLFHAVVVFLYLAYFTSFSTGINLVAGEKLKSLPLAVCS
jgi:hypothetical protein